MIHGRRWFLLYSLFLPFLLLGSLMPVAEGNFGQVGLCEKLKPCRLLVQSDAERMLGQPVRLIQDTSELRGDRRQCGCGYTGVSKDKASGQDSYLFFAVEEKEGKPSVEQARQMIQTTKEENAHDSTILDLTGMGDEAFLLSNDSYNHFIMVRKGAIIMRLQMKNAPSKKSLDELKAFAEKISKQL